VLAVGGVPELVAAFKPDENIIDIEVLPGSRAALVTLTNYRNTWIVAQPLDGGAAHVVVPSGSHARYVSSQKSLVYRTSKSPSRSVVPLETAPFDPVALRLTGSATRLAVDAAETFAISSTGTLAHVTRWNELVRVFRDGSRRSLGNLPGDASMPRVSPDGKRLAYSINGLWVADLARLESTTRRLTLDTTDWQPVWSPDGHSIAFGREVREPGTETSTESYVWWPRAIYSISVDGRSPAQRLALHGDTPMFWSPVTGRVAYQRYIHGAAYSLWTTSPGEGTSRQVFRSVDPLHAALSRDGRWLAFEWTRGGASGFDDSTYIYVSPFRSGGKPIEMPAGDAHNPVWSLSSDELFFAKDGRLLVTQLRTSAFSALTFSEPVMVYDSGQRSESRYFRSFEYDVMPDGGSILVKVSSSPKIEVVPDITSRGIQ
jgi:Tol biopolymer transport system component